MLPVAELKHKLISGPTSSLCAAIALLCVLSTPAVAADPQRALEGTELLSLPAASAPSANSFTAPVAAPPQSPALASATVMGTPIDNGRPVTLAPVSAVPEDAPPPALTPSEAMPQATRQMNKAAAVVTAPDNGKKTTAAHYRRNFGKPVATAMVSEEEDARLVHAATSEQEASKAPRKPGMVERMIDGLFGDDDSHEDAAAPVASETVAVAAPAPAPAPLTPQPDMFLSAEAVTLDPPVPAVAPDAYVPPQPVAPLPVAAVPVIEELPPIYMSPPNIIVSASPPAKLAAAAVEPAPLPTQELPEGKPVALVPEPEMVAVAPAAPAPVAPIRSEEEESAARVMPAADMMARAGSNFDPSKPRAMVASGWRGERGQTLRQVLESWCATKNIRLYWDTDYDYPLQASVMIDDSFENAVRALLDGFAAATPQPIGRLHRQSQIGESVLIVQTRGNRYGN